MGEKTVGGGRAFCGVTGVAGKDGVLAFVMLVTSAVIKSIIGSLLEEAGGVTGGAGPGLGPACPSDQQPTCPSQAPLNGAQLGGSNFVASPAAFKVSCKYMNS